jgi:hypothetical protein
MAASLRLTKKETNLTTILGVPAVVNFSYDIEGTQDTRPGTWGDTGVQQISDPFSLPAGVTGNYKVRITRIYGDFCAMPAGLTGGTPTPGKFGAVLWGLTNSTPQGNPEEDFSAEGCLVWVQQFMNATDTYRIPFDFNVTREGLLNADNILQSKAAVFLNQLGCSIHMECTFVCEFQFEEQS